MAYLLHFSIVMLIQLNKNVKKKKSCCYHSDCVMFLTLPLQLKVLIPVSWLATLATGKGRPSASTTPKT